MAKLPGQVARVATVRTASSPDAPTLARAARSSSTPIPSENSQSPATDERPGGAAPSGGYVSVLDLTAPIQIGGSEFHQLAFRRVKGADFMPVIDARDFSSRIVELVTRCARPAIDDAVTDLAIKAADVDTMSEADVDLADQAFFSFMFGSDEGDDWEWDGGPFALAHPVLWGDTRIETLEFRPRSFKELRRHRALPSASAKLREFLKTAGTMMEAPDHPITDALINALDALDLMRINGKIMGKSQSASGRLRAL